MKTKNKKLFALLMLPAVIAMMVLPLCSFTTVQTTDYWSLESRSRIDIGYTYNRGGASSYIWYTGSIPSSQRLLVPNGISSPSSIMDQARFYACDYYMGDTNKSIDMMSFSGSSSLKSTLYMSDDFGMEDEYELGLAYKSDNINYSWFNGDFEIYDYNSRDDIFIELWDYQYHQIPYENGLYFRNMYITVDVVIALYDYEVPTFVYDKLSYTGSLYDLMNLGNPNPRGLSYTYIDVSQIVYTIVSELNTYEWLDYGQNFLIPSVFIDVLYDSPDSSEEVADRFGAIRVNSNCVEKDENNSSYFDVILKFLGSGRYADGYNAGISKIDEVWPSLGAFLQASVGAFTNIAIFPNFTIGTLLSLIAGALLLITFLKMFAGG